MLVRNSSRLLLGVLLLSLGAAAALAKDFPVSPVLTGDSNDTFPGDGICKVSELLPLCGLRAAVQEANAWPGNDRILLPAGHFRLTISNVGGLPEDEATTGDLDITENLSIIGSGVDDTIIDASGIDRVFDVLGEDLQIATLELDGVTVTGGLRLGDSIDYPGDSGGGILVREHGALQLLRSRLEGNQAKEGAAILADRAVSIEISESEISRNTTRRNPPWAGSSIFLSGMVNGQIEITRSAVYDNGCATDYPTCNIGVLIQSCITGQEWVTVANSTFSANRGPGLFFARCNAVVTFSTLVDNQIGLAFTVGDAGERTLLLANSIVAHNGSDCHFEETLDVDGYGNLSSDTTCGLDPGAGNLEGVDPLLLPLGYYGEATPSHPPQWDSPVVDATSPLYEALVDQHGYPRPLDGNHDNLPLSDVGAIEALPCDHALWGDIFVVSTVVTSGTIQSCGILHAGPGVEINIGPVYFLAREFIEFDNDFSVAMGTTFTAGILRTAGSPP